MCFEWRRAQDLSQTLQLTGFCFVEFVPVGPIEFTDEATGAVKRIMNDRHVRMTGSYGKSKLSCGGCKELVDLFEKNEHFFRWCTESSAE